MWLASRTHPLLLIAVASVVLALPLFFRGFPLGHDSPWHLVYQKHFAEQFWNGELYPRWLAGANAGLGSPIFFVYGPVPYWVGSLLRPLVSWLPWWDRDSFALALSAFLALLASGLAAYLWLRDACGGEVAAAGAVIYMAMPYHLIMDLYLRSALAEQWAFVWMPLMLYFSKRLVEGNRLALPGLAAAFAMLVMSHLFSTFIFSGFAILYACLFLPKHRRGGAVARLLCGLGLGIGLAAIYLGPALAHAQYMAMGQLNLAPNLHYANNFLTPSLTRGDGITLVTLLTLVAAVWGFSQTRFPATRQLAGQRLFWLAAGLFCLVMMLPLTKPLWRALPILQVIQFPWRFNIVLAVAATALLTMAMGKLQASSAKPLRVTLMVLPWVLAMSVIGTIKAGEMHHRNVTLVRSIVDAGYEGMQMRLWARGIEWGALGPADIRKSSSEMGQVRTEDGGQAEVVKWAPRDIRMRVRSEREGWVVARQLYYPGWEAQVAATNASLKVEPTKERGLIRVWVPAGQHEVGLRLDGGPMERLGVALSGVCLLGVAFLCWRGVARARLRPSS